MNGRLTEAQSVVLLQGVAPSRVAHDEGRSNMQAFDIRAMLIRVFGFANWDDVEVNPTTMIFEDLNATTQKGDPAVVVAYKATRRLIVRDRAGVELCRYEQSAVGDWKMPIYLRADAHDNAIKAAESQALKRCAVNLGDQFGLSLYNKGSIDPVVRKLVDDGVPDADK